MEIGQKLANQKNNGTHTVSKKGIFILASAAAVLVITVCTLLFYYTDVPILWRSGANVNYTFKTAGKKIAQCYEDGGNELFTVKGIGLSQSFAEAADYDGFITAFEDIAAMNANTVRVEDVMKPAFYHALHDYNASAKAPLYLMQGVRLSDEEYARMTDGWADGMKSKLVTRCRLAVDAVHGGRRGSLTYRFDVSRYVVGFAVGNDWDSDLVIYTNIKNEHRAGEFSGKYVEVWDTSQAFETLLAFVLDDLISYETGKYNYQTPVGIQNGMGTDALLHSSDWSPGLYEVVASVNTIHFSMKDTVKAGYFAAYHAEAATMQFLSFDPAYNAYIGPDGGTDPYLGYLTKLSEQHPMPVIITQVSATSARGKSGIDEVTGYDRGGTGEEGQAAILSALVSDIFESGCAGGCVSTYRDDLYAAAWNEKDAGHANGNWKNVQDTEQNTGLIAVEPSRPCILDGDFSEWTDIEPSLTDGASSSLKYIYDEAYLYLFVESDSLNLNSDTICIPLDITPQSGGRSMGSYSFDMDADFVVLINGAKSSRLFVHEHYNRLYFDKGYEIWNVKTKEHQPDRNSTVFHNVQQYCRPSMFDANSVLMPAVTVHAGALVSGNESDNSVADFCFGQNGVEIRIPWALLNFTDPSEMMIIGDLYARDKTEITIDSIGACLITTMQGGRNTGASSRLMLTGWGRNTGFTTRKKAACDALAQIFSEQRKQVQTR